MGIFNRKHKEHSASAAGKAADTVRDAVQKSKDTIQKSKDAVMKTKDDVMSAIDENSDGIIDIEEIIRLGLRVPGIQVDREKFLRSVLEDDFPEKKVAKAVSKTPSKAKIPIEDIDKIADEVIQDERLKVSGISAALGVPGGVAMVATIPTDIAQFYGYMLRAAQKLLYLYGFPEIDVTERGSQFDSDTINMMTLCLGTMYGVAGANTALKSMANSLTKGVSGNLIKKALAKRTVYPMIRQTAKWFGINMTKQSLTNFFANSIPIVGGIAAGTITYLSFKPCCDKLKSALRETRLVR